MATHSPPKRPGWDELIDDLIAGGHPQQHVPDWAAADLNSDGKIVDESEFEVLGSLIRETLEAAEDNGDVKSLRRGRTGWFDRTTGRIVVHNPRSTGTGLIPDEPERFWNGLS